MNPTEVEQVRARLSERFRSASSIRFDIRPENTLNPAQWKFLDALSKADPKPGFINVCSLPTGSGKSLMECLLPFLFACNEENRVLVIGPTLLLTEQLFASFKHEHDTKLNRQFSLKRKMRASDEYGDIEPSTLRVYDRIGASKGAGSSAEYFQQKFTKKFVEKDKRVMFANIHQVEKLVDYLKQDQSKFKFTHIIIDEGHHIDERRFAKVINYFIEAEVFLFTATEFKINWKKAGLASREHGLFVKYYMTDAVANHILKKPVLVVKSFNLDESSLTDQKFGGLSTHTKTWQAVLYSPSYIRAMANEMLLCLKNQLKDNPTARAVCKVDTKEHCERVYSEIKKLVDGSPDPDVAKLISVPYYSGMRNNQGEKSGFSLSDEQRKHFDNKMKQHLKKASNENPYSILIQPRLCSEGYDDPYITTVVFFSMAASMSEFVQLCGRGTRFPNGRYDAKNRLCYILMPHFFTDQIEFFAKWSRDIEIYNDARLPEEDLIEVDDESGVVTKRIFAEDSNQSSSEMMSEDSNSQSSDSCNDSFSSNNTNVDSNGNNTNVMYNGREEREKSEEESSEEERGQAKSSSRSGRRNVERALQNIHPTSDSVQFKFFVESEDYEADLQTLKEVIGDTAVALVIPDMEYLQNNNNNNNNVVPEAKTLRKTSNKRKRSASGDSKSDDKNPSPKKKQRTENLPKDVDAWINSNVYHAFDKNKQYPGILSSIGFKNGVAAFKITFEEHTMTPNQFVKALAPKFGKTEKEAGASASYERFWVPYGEHKIPLDELKALLTVPQGV